MKPLHLKVQVPSRVAQCGIWHSSFDCRLEHSLVGSHSSKHTTQVLKHLFQATLDKETHVLVFKCNRQILAVKS
jgi:hypothetical protein